jgi:hypothetical protein
MNTSGRSRTDQADDFDFFSCPINVILNGLQSIASKGRAKSATRNVGRARPNVFNLLVEDSFHLMIGDVKKQNFAMGLLNGLESGITDCLPESCSQIRRMESEWPRFALVANFAAWRNQV